MYKTLVHRRGRLSMTALPPGPNLPLAAQTYMLWGHTLRFLAYCRRRHGDVFTVHAAPMGKLVYFADPAAIKEVFTGDNSLLHAGEANNILEPVMGPTSVLLTDDAEHLRSRKLMLPMFHGDAVRRYSDVVEEVTEAEVDSWRAGETIALHPRMRALTFEVILRAVVGVTDPQRLDAMRAALPAAAEIKDVVTLMWLWPQLGRFGPWKRYNQTLARADALLYEEIRARRAAPDLAERTDVLSLLLQARDESGEGMSDRELRDQVVTLLLAGHETTATSLSWAFERLTRNPDALARATEGDDAYLDAVTQETLRVRPVITDVVRKLKRPATIAGVDLPAGVLVTPAIGLVQRDARRFENPFAFRPERFLGDGAAPYTWIPFGGGIRRCLGAAFATMEMRVVMRTILGRATLRADRPQSERTRPRHITQVPARGARVVVERVAPRRETDSTLTGAHAQETIAACPVHAAPLSSASSPS